MKATVKDQNTTKPVRKIGRRLFIVTYKQMSNAQKIAFVKEVEFAFKSQYE